MGLSQKELAQDICSQPMISSIEHGTYVPNVVLFMQLCDRLNINLDDSFLKTALKLNSNADFSNHVFELCKRHEYAKMIAYMDEEQVIDSLTSVNDFQTYYYYYGCALYQLKHDALGAKRYFNTAALYGDVIKNQCPESEVEILIFSAMGVIELQLGHPKKALDHFLIARKSLDLAQNKSENLNVINYQYGLALYNLTAYNQALSILLEGFDRVRKNESYFMLPEYALLIMNCHQKMGNSMEAGKYKMRYEVFSDMD
ncbi:helix-turn-helix transcriptional regulator [Weissella paramesenteroides]|nr:helix-turn-helix transcriptional regulator [Weissella paramesenteroides]KAA8438600.1 helix-turn-helix transcriptional regulator [Weissella paramesenteroides]